MDFVAELFNGVCVLITSFQTGDPPAAALFTLFSACRGLDFSGVGWTISISGLVVNPVADWAMITSGDVGITSFSRGCIPISARLLSF
jgi:hypothetical protein